ncbi:hypothetical protein ASF21_09855 [Arthrobacter sp. Leaf234]|uniref:helix-turn-helix transcriptional regulator n=1 Tax=Arthrobacter sp. Leaf234 TaxID=1736303 RepID=UPI0006F864A0|nr:LuxR family transcriptional regulator [Arthrobacter sp. Leaf234]KQO01855.1 hypothetical protein ASF21_09855 [Arthrobacter sp. Leaf234]
MFSALSGDVPLVGRKALITAIEQAVREADVYGAFVYGEIGTGKSAMARHLHARLQGEFVPFLLSPASALVTIPYGALAPFLVEASSADMASPLAVLRRVMAFLRTRAAGRRVLVLVDDAHLLDDDSSHLLAQLVTSRTIALAAFARPITPVSDELASLCRDGLLERFEVGPLGSADALDLCRQVLGGPIVRGASERLRDEASGNPLFLKAILDEALARGSLIRPDGVWTLDVEEVALPASLLDLVRSIALGLNEIERKAFDLVALAGVVAFNDLVRLTSEGAVSSLLDEGLIRSVWEDPAYATQAYSLYGRIGLSLVPVGRSSSLHDELRSIVGPGGNLPASAVIRDVLWRLDCGEQVPDEHLLQTAESALAGLDARAALRCVSAVRNENLLGLADILRASALMELGRTTESRSAADRCPEATVGPKQVAAAGILAVRQVVADGEDPVALTDVLDWWSSCIRSWKEGPLPAERGSPAEEDPALTPLRAGEGPPSADAVRECEHHLVVARAFSWNILGEYSRTVEVLAGFVTEGHANHRVTVLAEATLAEALGALGRGVEGRRHSLAAVAAAGRHQQPIPDLHRGAFLRHVSLLVHSGDFRAAEEALATYTPGESRDYFFIGGGLAVVDAVLDARRGFFREALAKLGPALASLRVSDQEALLPYALGVTAWTAAALGEISVSTQCSRELAVLRHRGSRQYELLGRAFDAAARALLRADDASVHTLSGLALAARRHGWSSAEKDILELATALGDDQAPHQLRDVTVAVEGMEAEVLHHYASALVRRDAKSLVIAGDRAEVLQKYLLATDACRRAMDVYGMQGDARSKRVLAAVLRRRQSHIDGGLAEEAYDSDGTTPLTSREKEIALLAIRGLSNREIARALTVSTRTVEGHLYRIYVKLGISRRDELTAELETVLRAT